MLNFDMVGRLNPNSMILRITRDDNYSEIDSLLFKVKPEKLILRITSENKNFTDASAFYSFGITSLFLKQTVTMTIIKYLILQNKF